MVPEQPELSRPVVLVVEDEVLVRMMLADVLDDAGFKVVEAAHADEALRVLSACDRIRAVVTDVEMPRGSMNGFQLARRIKQLNHRIGVLVISGRAAPRVDELPDGGMFLSKPVHTGTLVRVLRSLLAA